MNPNQYQGNNFYYQNAYHSNNHFQPHHHYSNHSMPQYDKTQYVTMNINMNMYPKVMNINMGPYATNAKANNIGN
jgi:hypothetical protein